MIEQTSVFCNGFSAPSFMAYIFYGFALKCLRMYCLQYLLLIYTAYHTLILSVSSFVLVLPYPTLIITIIHTPRGTQMADSLD